MIYCFDIDGTICATPQNFYKESIPDPAMIKKINELYDSGDTIKFFTARGGTSGIDWTDFTMQQLEEWGVKYHTLITNQKPHFDILIDDKCIHVDAWKKENLPQRRGFIAGCFDLIHPGYIKMWEDAKTVCDYLVIGLQTDPTIDRPTKNKPVHSLEERHLMLSAIKFIDEIVIYESEKDLYNLLKNLDLDVRILGTDYKDIKYNGWDLGMEVYFHERDHSWSATNLRQKISNSRRER